MAVTSFQDFDLADAERDWDSDAADKRVRKWAGAEDEPTRSTAAHTSGTTRTPTTTSPRTSCPSAMSSTANSSPYRARSSRPAGFFRVLAAASTSRMRMSIE